VENLAKAFLDHLIKQDCEPHTQRFGDEGWSVTINGAKLAPAHTSDLTFSGYLTPWTFFVRLELLLFHFLANCQVVCGLF
jgi:hypothetical protein